MNFSFEDLFSVEFRHKYYAGDGLYNGISILPTEETKLTLLNTGLIFKGLRNGFKIGYDTNFAGSIRNREDVLNSHMLLIFRLDLSDAKLYNYTGNLPANIRNLIFHFWNYSQLDKTYRNRLQKNDFIGEEDMNDLSTAADLRSAASKKAILENRSIHDSSITEDLLKGVFKDKPYINNITLLEDYFAKPFGQISIKLNAGLEKKFILQFDSLATHWRYILRSAYLQNLVLPAITTIKKSDQLFFKEPVEIMLTDNQQVMSFISTDKIPLSDIPHRMFKLVNNNIEDNPVIPVLPDPDINLISAFDSDETNKAGNIISNIIL